MSDKNPIFVDWDPNAPKIEHSMIASRDGVFQCLCCGIWSKDLNKLQSVPCMEIIDATSIEQLEVK